MRIADAATGRELLPRVFEARSFFARLRGLLFRAPLAPGEALLIAPCASVHSFAMTYALDLAFLDRRGRVLKLVCDFPPRRLAACARAAMVLEMPAGSARQMGLHIHQSLQLSE